MLGSISRGASLMLLRNSEFEPLVGQKGRVEIELTVERTFDVVGPPKPVLLTIEQQIQKWDAPPAKRLDHLFGLLWGDNPIFGSLKKGDWHRYQPGAVHRGPGDVQIPTLRVGPNQAIEVA